jgi:hypothetical protein
VIADAPRLLSVAVVPVLRPTAGVTAGLGAPPVTLCCGSTSPRV